MGMNKEQEEKLFEIRCRDMRGRDYSNEESKFCQKMLSLYPDEYKKISEKARIATLPFGAKGTF